MPMEKLRTGGTAPELNSEDACSIVPSPPKVTTKSIFSGLAEILVSKDRVRELGHSPGCHTSAPRGISFLSSWNTRTSEYLFCTCLLMRQYLTPGISRCTCSIKESIACITGGVRILLTTRILRGGC